MKLILLVEPKGFAKRVNGECKRTRLVIDNSEAGPWKNGVELPFPEAEKTAEEQWSKGLSFIWREKMEMSVSFGKRGGHCDS